MPRTNWLRMIIGILIATLIMFFRDGFFHERIVVADWTAVYTALGSHPPVHSTANLLYFIIFELGRGILAMSLYVMLRVCWKPGPAARRWRASSRGLLSQLPARRSIPLGFFSHALWLKIGGFHLITSIIAAIAGAAVYKEGK